MLFRHLITFLLFYLATIFFYLICRQRFKSYSLALLSTLFLILSPRIFAHSFYNSKDLAFLSIFIISIYTLEKFLQKRSFTTAFFHAFVSAVLIGIRVMGIFIPALTLLIFAISIFHSTKKYRQKSILVLLIIYLLLLILLTVLFWPILLENPLNIFEAFKNHASFSWTGSVLFLGDFIEAANLPWYYIPVWIAVTTPILYILFFLVGSFSIILKITKEKFKKFTQIEDLIYLLWFAVPLLAILTLNSVVYNGWRHLFFIYPSLIIISTVGILALSNYFKKILRKNFYNSFKIILTISIIISILTTTNFIIKNHPHQYVYFNIIGTHIIKYKKVNFDSDYWGLSYRKSLEYIVGIDERDTINIFTETPAGALNSLILKGSDRHRVFFTDSVNKADYYIGNDFRDQDNYPCRNEVFNIEVQNEIIMSVCKLK